MSDETTGGAVNTVPPFEEGLTAPFIYFDIVPAHGIMNGAIQVELASRVLIPGPDNSVLIKFIASGRIRCSPTAAGYLRDALEAALKMLQQPQEAPTAASKLN